MKECWKRRVLSSPPSICVQARRGESEDLGTTSAEAAVCGDDEVVGHNATVDREVGWSHRSMPRLDIANRTGAGAAVPPLCAYPIQAAASPRCVRRDTPVRRVAPLHAPLAKEPPPHPGRSAGAEPQRRCVEGRREVEGRRRRATPPHARLVGPPPPCELVLKEGAVVVARGGWSGRGKVGGGVRERLRGWSRRVGV